MLTVLELRAASVDRVLQKLAHDFDEVATLELIDLSLEWKRDEVEALTLLYDYRRQVV